MKTSGKWPDFLFTLVVRATCGVVMGLFVGFLLCAPVGRKGAKRPLVVWLFGDAANPNKPYYWFGGFGLIGAAVAMLTTPKWQTPWYKRTPIKLAEGFSRSPDSLVVSDATIYSSDGQERVHIQVTDEFGQVHNYASVDELPLEYRAAIDAIRKQPPSKADPNHSTTEVSQSGDAVVTRTVEHRSSTQYKFKDESGRDYCYHSLEDMPPELRAAVIAAKNESKTQP